MVAVQPNFKFCLFSESVDDFIVYDATESEIAEYCMDKWGSEVSAMLIRRAKAVPELFALRLAEVTIVHGNDYAKKVLRKCSK